MGMELTVSYAAAASRCANMLSGCLMDAQSGCGGDWSIQNVLLPVATVRSSIGFSNDSRLCPSSVFGKHSRNFELLRQGERKSLAFDGQGGGGGSSVGNGRRFGLRIEAVVKRSPKRLKYINSAGSRKDLNLVYIKVDTSGADTWKLEQIVELLKDGAVGVIPTDTVYAIVCDLKNRQAVERLYRIKNMDAKKPLSILCRSFQDIDTYTLGFPRGNSHGQTNVFRAARQCLPGPYTFILPASKEMPKQCTNFGGNAAASYAPRKSVGVRMPDDAICRSILERLDEPLLCTSVRMRADDQWMLDPVIIADTYGSVDGREGLDFVVDGGEQLADASTVVDMTGLKPVVLRKGKGIVEDWMLMEAHDSTESASAVALLNPYAS